MTLFNIHRDILSRSPVLCLQMQDYLGDPSIMVSNISASAFDLVVRFLYGCPFDDLKPGLAVSDTESLRPACEILCFALKYKFEDLRSSLITYFSNLHHMNYQSVLSAAKFVYTNAPIIEPWFQDFVYNRTQEALADPSMVDETWFTETFEHGYNGLSKYLFECYRNFNKSLQKDACDRQSEQSQSFDKRNYDHNREECQIFVHKCLDEVDEPKYEMRESSVVVEEVELEGKADELASESNWIQASPVAQAGLPPSVSAPDTCSLDELVSVAEESPCTVGKLPRLDSDACSFDELAPVTEEPSCAVAQLPRPDYESEDPVPYETSTTEVIETGTLAELTPRVPEPLSVEEGIELNLCSRRQRHLNSSEWVSCYMCSGEVLAMARRAAWR